MSIPNQAIISRADVTKMSAVFDSIDRYKAEPSFTIFETLESVRSLKKQTIRDKTRNVVIAPMNLNLLIGRYDISTTDIMAATIKEAMKDGRKEGLLCIKVRGYWALLSLERHRTMVQGIGVRTSTISK